MLIDIDFLNSFFVLFFNIETGEQLYSFLLHTHTHTHTHTQTEF